MAPIPWARKLKGGVSAKRNKMNKAPKTMDLSCRSMVAPARPKIAADIPTKTNMGKRTTDITRVDIAARKKIIIKCFLPPSLSSTQPITTKEKEFNEKWRISWWTKTEVKRTHPLP
jgi:hypothetical protein